MSIESVSAKAYGASLNPELTSSMRKDAVGDSSNYSVNTSVSPNSTVSISSNAIMMSRLFPNSPPKMITNFNPMAWETITSSGLDYLTKSDLATISDMYSFAQEQGYDLQYVDSIAVDLGQYRKRANGTSINNFNDGTNYDKDGYQLTVAFTDERQKAAERLQKSEGFNSTSIDQGFLQKILDPGYGALSTRSDFDMLAVMVNRFSNATQAQTSTKDFSTYTFAKIEAKFIKNESVKLEYGVAEHIRVNNTWVKGGVQKDSLDSESVIQSLTSSLKIFDDSILDLLLQRIQSLNKKSDADLDLISLWTMRK